MGRELIVVWAGRHRRDDWERLCASYRERIGRQMPLREVPVKARRGAGEGRRRVAAEAESMLAALPEPCWTVVLDREGTARSSGEVAEWLKRRLDGWPHPIAFLIGSDLGVDPSLKQAARERWSLGPLTLPHELARLVLYEQLYRSLSIAAGIKYHRQPL